MAVAAGSLPVAATVVGSVAAAGSAAVSRGEGRQVETLAVPAWPAISEVAMAGGTAAIAVIGEAAGLGGAPAFTSATHTTTTIMTTIMVTATGGTDAASAATEL